MLMDIFKKDNWDDFKRDEDRKKAVDAYLELKENARDALEKLIETCSEMYVLTPLLDEPTHLNIDKSLYEDILRRVVDKMRSLLTGNKQLQIEFFKNKSLKKIIDLKKTYKKLKDELMAFDFYDQSILNFFSEDYEMDIRKRYDLV